MPSSRALGTCSMRWRTTGTGRGTATGSTWSASSRSSPCTRTGRAGPSPSPPAGARRPQRAVRPSSSPVRRPGWSCPSDAGRASATPASESCAPVRFATCETERSPGRRARWSAPASTPPRAQSRSSCDDPRSKEEDVTTTETESPLAHLTPEQIDELEAEFNAIHDEVFSELGDSDRRYIQGMIEMHRRLGVIGRALLVGSRFKPAWLAGTSALSLAKILENMEIGHNVLHGQWDWMNDPQIHSSTWDWDTASTSEAWKHSHNYIHHTYTNIRGKDRDLGYEIMRIDPHQPWHPVYLLQPIYNLILMALFEWGVALHDLDLDAVWSGDKSHADLLKEVGGITYKMRLQVQKDYIAWPALSALIAGAVTYGVRRSGVDDKVASALLGKRGRAKRTARGLGHRAKRRGLASWRARKRANEAEGRLAQLRASDEPLGEA